MLAYYDYDFQTKAERDNYLRAFPKNGLWRAAAQEVLKAAAENPAKFDASAVRDITSFIKQIDTLK